MARNSPMVPFSRVGIGRTVIAGRITAGSLMRTALYLPFGVDRDSATGGWILTLQHVHDVLQGDVHFASVQLPATWAGRSPVVSSWLSTSLICRFRIAAQFPL